MVEKMKLNDKLDKLIADVNEIKVIQARQEILHQANSQDLRQNKEDIKEHMRRTDLNEKRITALESERKVAWWVVSTILTGLVALVGLAKTLELI